MQIIFEDERGWRELDLRVHNPDATVADLARALTAGTSSRRGLVVDGHIAAPDLGLDECGLRQAAVVTLAKAPGAGRRAAVAVTSGPCEGHVAEVVVVGGLDAGGRFALAPGTAVVGRSDTAAVRLDDPTASTEHATITVDAGGGAVLDDLGSRNGTLLAGEVVTGAVQISPDAIACIGSTQLEVRDLQRDDRAAAPTPHRRGSVVGAVPFNRPPRPALPPPVAAVVVPAPPRAPGGATSIGIVSVLAPIGFSALMVAVTGSFTYALFALLSPVMLLANSFEARRRSRREARRDQARFDSELETFDDAAAATVRAERQRRRQEIPDVAETLRRAARPSTRLWERRRDHPDFLSLGVGIGALRWSPPFDETGWGRGVTRPETLASIIERSTVLVDCPVVADLAGGGVVGLVGDRSAALALARSLVCQATTQSGPADLALVVLTAPGRAGDWDWAKWLPHARDGGGGRLLCADPAISAELAESLLRAWKDGGRPDDRDRVGPVHLIVVDDEVLTEGRKAPVRAMLRGAAGPVAGIVVASVADRLPAMCSTIVTLDGPLGDAMLARPQVNEEVGPFLAAGLSERTARDCARSLSRFEDPELDVVGAGLPARLRLLPLLEIGDLEPAAITARWSRAGPMPRPAAPIGVSEDGVFEVDLDRDGPHGLVAGTTGAGKSELLRTVVAGLATSLDPDHLTFMLVDFKGGSAFAECARLPHTVGMVTDLDESLAERALRCLDAEVRYRERLLRDAAASDLGEYLGRGSRLGPLPRLVVVIDEFATLKAELPNFVDALVSVAQRGRSLGIHLLLATQRPSGAVSENIRANTNLRVALRVQDGRDSADVIDVPDAARIPRSTAGRAYVRLGAGEVVTIQTALSTDVGGRTAGAPVEVVPFSFGPTDGARRGRTPPDADGTSNATDLSLLVDAVRRAFAASGAAPPRRPWPDPLPLDVSLDALTADAGTGPTKGFDGSSHDEVVALALADDPEAQTQYPIGWRADGHMLIYGMGGSGTSTALGSVAVALAQRVPSDDLHIYALDFGAGELAPLAGLPHTGAVITASDRERQIRLVRLLRAELERRREGGGLARSREPRLLVLVDGFPAFQAAFDDLAGQASWNDFQRIWSDGPDVGIVMVATSERAGAIPSAFTAAVRDRLVLRLADRADLGLFGLRGRAVPAQPPGRGIVADTAQVVQLARPLGGDLVDAVERVARRRPSGLLRPAPIRSLPAEVTLAELGSARVAERPWLVPLGIGSRDLAPVGLTVYPGEHALVAGPARSGKSTALRTIAQAVRDADTETSLVLIAGPRSPLRTHPLFDRVLAPTELASLAAMMEPGAAPFLVVVDDAETVDDEGGALSALLGDHRDGLFVVVAGRNDVLRGMYSHWTRVVRRSKLGVLLRPELDFDGELLGATLPRWAPVTLTAGRGFLVNGGDAELVQLAHPPTSTPARARRKAPAVASIPSPRARRRPKSSDD